jgi:hypothetical protein
LLASHNHPVDAEDLPDQKKWTACMTLSLVWNRVVLKSRENMIFGVTAQLAQSGRCLWTKDIP